MKLNTFYLIAGLVAGIAICHLFHGCNKKPCNCPEVVLKSDTAKIKTKDSSGLYQPQPVSFDTTSFQPLEGGHIVSDKQSFYKKPVAKSYFTWGGTFCDPLFLHDTSMPLLQYKIDTMALVKDYYTLKFYSDTSKTKWGNVIIRDSLLLNSIISREVITDFTIPVVTKTISLREPPRNQLYLGVMAMGNPKEPLFGFGPSLMLKTKSDKVIELGALYGRDNYINYMASLKFKISFRRQ